MPTLYNSPFTANPPANPGGTKNTHWIVVRANGKIVGRIQRFAPTQNRVVTKVYELNRWSTGKAVDQVPGVVDADDLEIQGLELWTEPLEQALGATGGRLAHLADQYQPFEISEVWYRPGGGVETRTYFGCFLTQINPDPLEGAGDKIYRKTARLAVLGRLDS